MNRIFTTLIATATLGLNLPAQTPPKNSPFVKPSGASNIAKPTADTPEDLALSGIVSLGGSTLVCITVVAEKRSHWIKVGESAARINVLSHTPETGQVAIKYNGQTLNLELTKPTFDSASISRYSPVSSGPLPVAQVALDVPLTNKQKESEARHLVSDLLEIGIIQREAYRRAERGLPPADAAEKKP
jgi:hypothetical protein